MRSPEFKPDSQEDCPSSQANENGDMKPDEGINEGADVKITSEDVQEFLSILRGENPKKSGLSQDLSKLKTKGVEGKKGTFSMLCELWSVTPVDCKVSLIVDFIINPDALKARYYEEMDFQRNMKSRWSK